MTIAREEIFGPVLMMIPYDGEEEAIAMRTYRIWPRRVYRPVDPERARRVAARLRVGSVRINGAMLDVNLPLADTRARGMGGSAGSKGWRKSECKSVTG